MKQVLTKLLNIQTAVHAPKTSRNDFGKYNYRTAEQIYEAVKPYLKEQKCALALSDEIKQVGDRFYIVATATLCDTESDETYSVSSLAREAELKKGMDESQITGSCSSYARKYALSGMFLLDGNKDIDSLDNTDEPDEKMITKAQSEEIDNLMGNLNMTLSDVQKDLAYFKIKDTKELTEKNAAMYIKILNKRFSEKK